MKRTEYKHLIRLALVLAILLLLAVLLFANQQFEQAYDAARNALDNLPPINTPAGD
jgi:uncharacterized membrane protein affecting hemolysin expression